MTKQFEAGKTYHDRSSCDYDTIYSFEIVARTAKQLTIREQMMRVWLNEPRTP